MIEIKQIVFRLKVFLGTIFLIGLILVLVLGIFKDKRDRNLLYNYGRKTYAKVIQVYSGIRGQLWVKYVYYVNGKSYTGETRTTILDNIFVGDIYKVIYYPQNPEIHKIYLENLILDTIKKNPISKDEIESIIKNKFKNNYIVK